eukprot:SAG22_NODE_1356_length_4631_cov_2.105693_9_plen_134_part_00
MNTVVQNTVLQGLLIEDKAVEGRLALSFTNVSWVNASHYVPGIGNHASKSAPPLELVRSVGIENGGDVRFERCAIADDRNRSFFATGSSSSHQQRGQLAGLWGRFAVTNRYGCRVALGPAGPDVSMLATSCSP